MSVLAATTVAALLIASPSASDADRLAANGGFLLGNAHRCGIAGDRVVRAGERIRDLIVAAAGDDAGQEEDATSRFARFFIVSAVSDPAGAKAAASCRKVAKEFDRFERHGTVGNELAAGTTRTTAAPFRLGDGE